MTADQRSNGWALESLEFTLASSHISSQVPAVPVLSIEGIASLARTANHDSAFAHITVSIRVSIGKNKYE